MSTRTSTARLGPLNPDSTEFAPLVDKWAAWTPRQWAEHPYGYIMLDGKPIQLYEWQRSVIDEWWARERAVQTLIISTVKDTGKTELNAVILAYLWLTDPGHYVSVAHDLGQAKGRVWLSIRDMAQRHPVLSKQVRVAGVELEFLPTGSVIEALPTDAPGHEGGNFKGVSFTELGAFEHNAQVSNFEALTPKRGTRIRLIDSYAGVAERSPIFEPLFAKMLQSDSVSDSMYFDADSQTLAFIMQGVKAQERCWPGTAEERGAYYAAQRATLRPNTYRRYHMNEWTSDESAFISPEMWDACINKDLRPLPPGADVTVYAGLDVGIKSDLTALVGMYRHESEAGAMARPAWVHTWKPSPTRPVSLQEVADTIRHINTRYRLAQIRYDPSQAVNLAEQLNNESIWCREVPQSLQEMAPRGNLLYESIRDQKIEVFDHESDDPETASQGQILRSAALNAAAKEVSQGLHIRKAGSAKIDPIVAMLLVLPDVAGQRRGSPIAFVEW